MVQRACLIRSKLDVKSVPPDDCANCYIEKLSGTENTVEPSYVTREELGHVRCLVGQRPCVY